jgi:acyl CoA:acetate/3-ketoacid CoA transferase alpha subunit
MTYLTGHSQEISELLAALKIARKGVTGLRLIVEPHSVVRLELERLVSDDEVKKLTTWILKKGLQGKQLDD